MAKPKLKQPEIIDIDEAKFNADAESARPGMIAEAATREQAVEAAGRMLGQMDAAGFFATVADSMLVSIFENIKKSKAWQNLRTKNNLMYQNFSDFCEDRLGKSYKRLQEMSQNIRALGEQVYEQAQRLGLRQVDYNAIKALPAPDQELVRRAIEEAQTKEEVQQALEELATKYGNDRQALESQLKIAKEDNEANNELLAKKNKEIDRLNSKLKRIGKLPPDEALEAYQKEVQTQFYDCMGLVRGTLRHSLQEIKNYCDDNGMDCDTFLAGLVAQLKNDCTALQMEFSLPDIEAGKLADLAWVDMSEEEIKQQTQAMYGEKLAALNTGAGAGSGAEAGASKAKG